MNTVVESETRSERFEPQQLLGQGGMGQVVKAHDPRLDRDIALKTLLPAVADTVRARFNREAQITGQLEHPNIPPVYELGHSSDGAPYLALKLIQGETLSAIVARLNNGDEEAHRHYSFTRRLQIIQQLCEAVHFAHTRGFLHRDIKPDNVMVGPFGEVMLMDWGLACPIERPAEPEAQLTAEFTFLGTPLYAAPERFAGDACPAADQYAIAATAYAFFTLGPPLKGASLQEIVTNVMTVVPEPMENFSHPIQGRPPREISLLVARAMSKKKDERFRDVAELRDEIQAILEGEIHAVCPHTTAKLAMHKMARQLDNHNRWLMPLLMLWLAYPLKDIVWLLYAGVMRILHH